MVESSHSLRRAAAACVLLALLSVGSVAYAAEEGITLQVSNAPVADVVEMIAAQRQVNIMMPGDVRGTVSMSLYNSPVSEALSAIATTAGYALEYNNGTYFILPHDHVGSYQNGTLTQVRLYEVDYLDGESLQNVLSEHLSSYGKVNFIPQRDVLIVEDQPDFLRQIDRLMRQIDREPKQVLIEAKILEITLNDDEELGIDWAKLFESDGGNGAFGVRGNTNLGAGFFFDLITPNVEVALNALQDEGRLHTLSTPKLVALESQEASVVIGDRRGYQVTTIINQVTTESIEFLESGVILRVTAEIDETGQILMEVHPEVSTGTVDANGVPSQTTTEVTTHILVPSGDTIFIGGLIKQSESFSRRSVPVVNRVPLVRNLFARREKNRLTTETVVLIRPILIESLTGTWNTDEIERVEQENIPSPALDTWSEAAADDASLGSLEVPAEPPDVVPRAFVTPPGNLQWAAAEADVRTSASLDCDRETVLFCYVTHCTCEATLDY